MSAVAGVAAVPGVTACVLYDEAGHRVDARSIERGGAGGSLDDAAKALARAMTIMGKGTPPGGIFARSGDGWILSRRMGGFTLLVTGRGAPRTAMLDVALAVLAARMQPARGHGRRVSVPTAQMSPDRGAPVGLTVLKELMVLLAHHIGANSARAVFKRELAALGESPHTVTRELYPYLVERLALRIPDPGAQGVFRRDARDLVAVPGGD